MRYIKFLIFILAILLGTPSLLRATEIDSSNSSAQEVCIYVADSYNAPQKKSIFTQPSNPIDIYNNGKPVNVYFTPQGNHGGYSLTVGEDENGAPVYAKGYDADGLWKLDRIYVISFKGRNYVVAEQDGGPIDVTDLGKGNSCRFHWVWSAILEEDHDHPLCEKVASESEFPQIPMQIEQGDIEKEVDVPNNGKMFLSREAFIKIEGARNPISVGLLTEMLPGGIANEMIAFLDKGEVSQKPRNLALLEMEKNFLANDWGGNVFLVSVDGRNLIEVDHSGHYNQITPSRALFRLSGNHLETLCNVTEKLKFEPAPAYYNMMPRKGAEGLFTLSVGGQEQILKEEEQKAQESQSKDLPFNLPQ